MTTPERDPVEELRQRALTAGKQAFAVKAELGELGDDFTDSLWRIAERCRRDADDPVLQAAARELVGGIGEQSIEWCVFVGDDPEDIERRIVGLSRRDAEEGRDRINTRDFIPGSYLDRLTGDSSSPARIAHCMHWGTAGRTPWQVVDTEGGETR